MKIARFFAQSWGLTLVLTLMGMAAAPFILVPAVQLDIFRGHPLVPTMSAAKLLAAYQWSALFALFSAGPLWFVANQSFSKSRTIQNQRSFIKETAIPHELVRAAYARFGEEEGKARHELAELVLESETMDPVIQGAPSVQDHIVDKNRYADTAKSLGFAVN
jgi:hypothetical protein